jgi:hypothetical protein
VFLVWLTLIHLQKDITDKVQLKTYLCHLIYELTNLFFQSLLT